MNALITAATGVTDPGDILDIEREANDLISRQERVFVSRYGWMKAYADGWEIVRGTASDPDMAAQMLGFR